AGQIGLDIDLTERWFVNIDVRYIDIDTKAKLNGSSLGTVNIDPWLYGLNLGFRL
ncbi:MAG: OmpW family protein, partial [Gammaproteobacteria bacterium]|nr:OmpW family protein [Gammaproteobacteria bacterium]